MTGLPRALAAFALALTWVTACTPPNSSDAGPGLPFINTSASSSGGGMDAGNGGCTSPPVCNPGCVGAQICSSRCTCQSVQLSRPSRSSPIDLLENDELGAYANHDDNSVILFVPNLLGPAAHTGASITGMDAPTSLVFHPNGNSFYVVDGRGLTRFLDTHRPARGDTLQVCAEPRAVALSPGGAVAYVGCLDGVVVLVDTESMTIIRTVALRGATATSGAVLPANASVMALAVTNDGDGEDGNENVIVPLFFYAAVRPVAGDNAGGSLTIVLAAVEAELHHQLRSVANSQQ